MCGICSVWRRHDLWLCLLLRDWLAGAAWLPERRLDGPLEVGIAPVACLWEEVGTADGMWLTAQACDGV